MVTTIPHHPAPAYAAAPAAVQSKLARDTVYMPSSVAVRLLGNATRPKRSSDDRSMVDGVSSQR